MPSDKFQQRLATGLQHLAQQHLLRTRRQVQAISSTACVIDGQSCISFASNDYLGLAHHPDVVHAFAAEAGKQVGSRASALVMGRTSSHEELERDIADFEHTGAAILFPTGYAANLGALTSLISARDAVFCDHDNHASIVDGCRSSAGELLVYRHQHLDRLHDSLRKRRSQFDQVFVVTDSVFSMDGKLAPLESLAEIAEEFDAILIVDEAHGTGVFGEHGRGVCEQQQVEQRIPIRIGTLSKAIGALGGFVAADQVICDWLWNTARSQFFSTALPPAVCAAAGASLKVIQHQPELRERLHARCRFAREELQRLDLQSMVGSQGPIIPVMIGDDTLAMDVSRQLQQAGFFVPAIRPPTVAPGTARLRISLCCEHTEQQITDMLRQVSEILHRSH